MFVDSVPGSASILVDHIPNVNGRLLAQLIFGYERDAHAPASVHTQEPSELAKRQLVIIDIHGGFAVFAAVTHHASEYVASRRPLVPALKVPDLRVSLRDFHGKVDVLGRELLLSPQNLVVKIEDLLIRHLPDVLSDFQVDCGDGGIVVFDYSILAFSLNSYFVQSRDTGSLLPHG
jgi:hypothetical protein